MTVSENYILYLASEGDTVKIKGNVNNPTLPEQLEASACKTHQQVLALLEKINSTEIKNTLSFYHVHNPSYDEHFGTWPKGVAHHCTLDKQISFVRNKISEAADGLKCTPSESTQSENPPPENPPCVLCVIL